MLKIRNPFWTLPSHSYHHIQWSLNSQWILHPQLVFKLSPHFYCHLFIQAFIMSFQKYCSNFLIRSLSLSGFSLPQIILHTAAKVIFQIYDWPLGDILKGNHSLGRKFGQMTSKSDHIKFWSYIPLFKKISMASHFFWKVFKLIITARSNRFSVPLLDIF